MPVEAGALDVIFGVLTIDKVADDDEEAIGTDAVGAAAVADGGGGG
jgi:hypothetical protein